jgi:enamine deaminase RidA (YjgF/YER057c/UK114 family)
LQRVGAALQDVVRTRIYIINIDYWQEVGKAHRVLSKIRPATTLEEASRMITPQVLVEIEDDAFISLTWNRIHFSPDRLLQF